MTNGERFRAFFARSKDLDRAPVIEWASWWDLTLKEWRKEGLPEGVDLNAYWGLDELRQFWLPIKSAGCPAPASHGAAIMETEEDYERIRPFLFGEETLAGIEATLRAFAQAQPDCPTWFSMDGFFWFPRTLFGIEGHLYAFYDEPELMLRINAVLKRTRRAKERAPVCIGRMQFSAAGQWLEVDGVRSDLTSKETELLDYLMSRPGEIISREELCSAVWGGTIPGSSRTVDTHIKQLRKAMQSCSGYITTIYGRGYRFEVD